MRRGFPLALVALLVISLVVSACSSAAPAPSKAPEGAKPETAKDPSKEADATAKYDALVQAAKKEGKLVLSSMEPIVREGIKDSFGKKFGMDVEYIALGPTDLVNRLQAERGAGQYNLDAVIQGPGTFILNLIPDGMVDRLDDVFILPEITDSSKWLDGKLPWNDPEHRVFRLNKYVGRDLSINPTLVKKEELKVYKDLLNPKWKGKIAAEDPTVLGPGGVVGAFLMVSFGEDFVRQLYIGQEVALSRDTRQLGDWLGRGRYSILVWGSNAAVVAAMQKDGLPIEQVMPEDVARTDAGWGSLALMNKAPHPNAAKLFANWLASKEGMQTWAKISNWPVTRVDVDQSALPDFLKLKPGMNYLDTAGYEYLTTKRTAAQNKVREIVKP